MNTSQLATYRAQIDALDHQLINLLKQRIQIVSQVGELKRSQGYDGCFIRSGREADMLRAIYSEFDGSDFHPLAACAIWRQIIAASTQHECPMVLITPRDCEAIATAYFGSFMPVQLVESIKEALRQAKNNPASLLILPPLTPETEHWFTGFAEQAPAKMHLFTQLPFARYDGQPYAYAAALLEPEPSAHDKHFVYTQDKRICVVEKPDEISHIRYLGHYGLPIIREEDAS